MLNFENSCGRPRNQFVVALASQYNTTYQWHDCTVNLNYNLTAAQTIAQIIGSQPSLNRYISETEILRFDCPMNMVAHLKLSFGEFEAGHDCCNWNHNSP